MNNFGIIFVAYSSQHNQKPCHLARTTTEIRRRRRQRSYFDRDFFFVYFVIKFSGKLHRYSDATTHFSALERCCSRGVEAFGGSLAHQCDYLVLNPIIVKTIFFRTLV
jgi:hypothetical protein